MAKLPVGPLALLGVAKELRLSASEKDHRRVLAVLAYLRQ